MIENPHANFDPPYADPGICFRYEAVIIVLRVYGICEIQLGHFVMQTITENPRMRNSDIVMRGQL